MSLFTETVNRVAELEKALADEKARNRNLEIALTAALRDKRRAQHGRYSPPPTSVHTELNSLSDDDVEQLFEQHEQERKQSKKWWQFFRK